MKRRNRGEGRPRHAAAGPEAGVVVGREGSIVGGSPGPAMDVADVAASHRRIFHVPSTSRTSTWVVVEMAVRWTVETRTGGRAARAVL